MEYSIPIKPFALANGLSKSEFIALAQRNEWYCYPSRFGEDNVTLLGKRFGFFRARKETLAGFKNPARIN